MWLVTCRYLQQSHVTGDVTLSVARLPSTTEDQGPVWVCGPLPMQNAVCCPALWYSRSPGCLTAPPKYPYVRLAAAVIVADNEGAVLLTRRASVMRTFPCAWVAPGGGLDHGETLPQCAARELAEETGIVVPPASLMPFFLWESVYPNTRELCMDKGRILSQYCVLFFLAVLDRPQPSVCLQAEETDMYAWVGIDQLDAFGTYSSVSSAPACPSSVSSGPSGPKDEVGSHPVRGVLQAFRVMSPVTPAGPGSAGDAQKGPLYEKVDALLDDVAMLYGPQSRDGGCGEAHRFAIEEYARLHMRGKPRLSRTARE